MRAPVRSEFRVEEGAEDVSATANFRVGDDLVFDVPQIELDDLVVEKVPVPQALEVAAGHSHRPTDGSRVDQRLSIGILHIIQITYQRGGCIFFAQKRDVHFLISEQN